MKNLFYLLTGALLLFSCSDSAAKKVKGKLKTEWSKDVTSQNVWQQYPRPQLKRDLWKNLNGNWKYTITKRTKKIPSGWDGDILVPFAVESQLSGVQKFVGHKQMLWYKREFSVPENWKANRIILHFEASDWETNVWINGKKVGEHRGGYDHFKFDITDYLKKGKNKIVVSVWDPTDKGWQPLGKQVQNPGGIFYTSVTGIWQTVWMEPVNHARIESLKMFPDIDNNVLLIKPTVINVSDSDQLRAVVIFNGTLISESTINGKGFFSMPVKNAKLWTPDTPNLYDIKIEVLRKNNVVDEVESYFGMRKISLGKDKSGFTRLMLNNKFVFQNGPLDQGYWPDGLYTPPTEEAMLYDLKVTKQMGFNMLRKHVKVESRRFYYWCDKMGLLVWQDMPNGDKKIGPRDPDIVRTEESEQQFKFELTQMIEQNFNNPSIVMWVPFNEGWGQFKTREIVNRVKEIDPTRLVNNASGWTDRMVGDVHDIHNYPDPACPPAEDKRAAVLGEFGGLGLKIVNHTWDANNWGYKNLKTQNELLTKYENYYTRIWNLKDSKGLSASVYTQTTDVETEANGLMTYDRKIIKASPEQLFKINSNNFLTAPVISPESGKCNSGDIVTINADKNAVIYFTTNGEDPTTDSQIYNKPILIKDSFTVKAIAILKGKKSRTVSSSFQITEIKRPQYKNKYSQKYTAGGDFALIDKVKGSEKYADGKWQGFHGKDLQVIIDLQKSTKLKNISINFLENQNSWIFKPLKVVISVSNDGNVYEVIKSKNFKLKNNPKTSIKTVTSEVKNSEYRFIKIFAKNTGIIPKWHKGQDAPAWLFVDEIEIK